MIHGPGCPVCVLPIGRIDNAIALAHEPGVILCTYGDLMRVPGTERPSACSRPRPQGADVRMVYSVADASRSPRQNPEREVVFFAIGFETTTPPTARRHPQGQGRGAFANFSRLLQPRADPAGDPAHSGKPGGPRHRHGAASTASSVRPMSATVIGSRALSSFSPRNIKSRS